eukprot:2610075-Alexandrium_andersonii.AAC.1
MVVASSGRCVPRCKGPEGWKGFASFRAEGSRNPLRETAMRMMWMLSSVGFVVLGSASCRMLRQLRSRQCAMRGCVLPGLVGAHRVCSVAPLTRTGSSVCFAALRLPVSYTHLRAHETSAHL